MGIFRKKVEPLEQRVLNYLSSIGREAAYMGDRRIELAGGNIIQLDNLEASLADVPARAHSLRIKAFVNALLESWDSPSPTLNTHRDQTYLRIMPADVVQNSDDAEIVAQILSDDLIVLPAVDLPHTIQTITSLEKFGDRRETWEVGMENLKTLPQPEHVEFQQEHSPDNPIHLFTAEDMFGASRILDLDAVLERAFGGTVAAPYGYLAIIPNRDLFGVHIIEDAGVINAIEPLLLIAQNQYSASVSLSGHVHYLSPAGTFTSVTRATDDDSFVVNIDDGPFGELLKTLGVNRDEL